MRTMLCCLVLVFALAACQKEIELPAEDPKTGRTIAATDPAPSPEPPVCPLPEPPPADTIYRAEPDQDLMQSQFGPMLRDYAQYQITEYYSVMSNLWSELPYWVKDDVYTFHRGGKGWVETNKLKHLSIAPNQSEYNWKLYADEEGLKLKWLDSDYHDIDYNVVAYTIDKSFTLCRTVNGAKVFYTYSFIGRK